MEDYYTHRNSAHRFAIQNIDDSGDIQLIDADGLTDESFTKIMRVAQHGLSSVAPQGSHMLALSLGGRRDMLVALGGEHPQYRPKNLGAGNTALYNADGTLWKLVGQDCTLDASGTLTITVKQVVIKASKFIVEGECHLGGDGGQPVKLCDDSCATQVYAV